MGDDKKLREVVLELSRKSNPVQTSIPKFEIEVDLRTVEGGADSGLDYGMSCSFFGKPDGNIFIYVPDAEGSFPPEKIRWLKNVSLIVGDQKLAGSIWRTAPIDITDGTAERWWMFVENPSGIPVTAGRMPLVIISRGRPIPHSPIGDHEAEHLLFFFASAVQPVGAPKKIEKAKGVSTSSKE